MDGSKTEVKQFFYASETYRTIARAYSSRFTFFKVSYILGGKKSLFRQNTLDKTFVR